MTSHTDTALTGEIVPVDEALFMDTHADFFDRRIGLVRQAELAAFRMGRKLPTLPPAYVIAAMGGAL